MKETTEPTDKMTNGTVTVELEISDPVTELGIETRLLKCEVDGSLVTDDLAQHIWDEHGIDVTDFGAEIAE